jgi:hypothetical protein
MLLYEDSVNVAREAGGRAPVSGLWFWGGGTLATTGPAMATTMDSRLRGNDNGIRRFVEDVKLYAWGGREGDLVRGIARWAGVEPSPTGAGWNAIASGNPSTSHIIVALSTLRSESELSSLAEAWIDPALRALRRGQLDNLRLIADAGELAAIWSVLRPSLLARVLSRSGGSTFVKPQPPAGE